MLKFLILTQLIIFVSTQSVVWNNNWATNCDFKNNDLSNLKIKEEECSSICLKTPGCTHYTWTLFNGGTCWMKKGSVSKIDAFHTKDYTVCGIVVSSSITQTDNENELTFRILNKCSYTIWPGIQGRKRSDSNWTLPLNGGWELGAGQTTTFTLPKDFDAGRIWARSNCTTVNGQFRCETGDCGFLQCAFDGIQRGGQTPATLAEFTLNGWGNQDYYDVSLVDGYNLQLSIVVITPNSEGSGQYWCTNPTCTRDLNQICPDVLKKLSSTGQVIGCLSACEKFNTDQYCCRGVYGTPEACKSINWPVNYPAFFKQVI